MRGTSPPTLRTVKCPMADRRLDLPEANWSIILHQNEFAPIPSGNTLPGDFVSHLFWGVERAVVGLPDCASIFGRHEFLIRRLHSLLGLMPIGGFLAFHLATNATIIDSPEFFQTRVDIIHGLGPTSLLMLEWPLIFLPILFHGVVGLLIVCRGKRNLANYTYAGNLRYTLQRWTGVIAFFYIFWHVFHMHGWIKADWWARSVAGPLGGASFDHHHAADTAAAAIQASAVVAFLYAAGILACVYHLANGIWTSGITWGLWTSPKAQRWANLPCVGVGVVLAAIGLGALAGMFAHRVTPTTRQTEAGGYRAVRVALPEPAADLVAPAASAGSLTGPSGPECPREEGSDR